MQARQQAVAAAEAAAVTVALQSARDVHRDELDRLQREKVGAGGAMLTFGVRY